LTIRDYIRSRNGAAMGLSHDVGHLGNAPLMPRNHLRNLFLAGQSIGHPGIVGTAIGGMILAGAMTGRDYRAELATL
jgi:phytoene dehydrogenase-like protein